MQALYTAEATATGGRKASAIQRWGASLELAVPKELGGPEVC